MILINKVLTVSQIQLLKGFKAEPPICLFKVFRRAKKQIKWFNKTKIQFSIAQHDYNYKFSVHSLKCLRYCGPMKGLEQKGPVCYFPKEGSKGTFNRFSPFFLESLFIRITKVKNL